MKTTKFIMISKRDGQMPKKHIDMFASTREEAISEFSEIVLKDIAAGDEYTWIGDAECAALADRQDEFKEKGAGYYANPNTSIHGREDFYAEDAQFSHYYEDVTGWGIEEVEEENDENE